MKRWILRSDGRTQRYNIKHIEKYAKTGETIKGANVWSKKFRKVYKILTAPKGETIVEPLLNKYTYHIKLKYNSDRKGDHSIMTEFTFEIVSEKEPTESKLKDLIISHLDELASSEEEEYNDFLLGIPFNEFEIGLTDIEETEESEGHKFYNVEYSHNLWN